VRNHARLSKLVLVSSVGVKFSSREERDFADLFYMPDIEAFPMLFSDPKRHAPDYAAMSAGQLEELARERRSGFCRRLKSGGAPVREVRHRVGKHVVQAVAGKPVKNFLVGQYADQNNDGYSDTYVNTYVPPVPAYGYNGAVVTGGAYGYAGATTAAAYRNPYTGTYGGSVAYHNLIAGGYAGELFPIRRPVSWRGPAVFPSSCCWLCSVAPAAAALGRHWRCAALDDLAFGRKQDVLLDLLNLDQRIFGSLLSLFPLVDCHRLIVGTLKFLLVALV
jgi:hypothetical protein